jgi:hypothetical protein
VTFILKWARLRSFKERAQMVEEARAAVKFRRAEAFAVERGEERFIDDA